MRKICVIAGAVIFSIFPPEIGRTIDRAIELAVIEEKWREVLEVLESSDPDNLGPIEKFLKNQACLIMGLDCAPVQIEPLPPDDASTYICSQWVDSVAEANPKSVVAIYLQSEIMSRSGNLHAAIDGYTVALSMDSLYAPAYNSRGFLYMRNGLYSRAISDYTTAIELNPQNPLAYTNRGAAYDSRGDYGKALADYEKALEIRPNEPSVLYNCGNTYRHKNELDASIEKYSAALALDSTIAAAYYNRGNSYRDLGQIERAVADYKEFLKYSTPDMAPQIENAKQRIAYFEGEGKQSISESEESLRKGIQYLEEGQLGQARNAILKAIELNPEESDAYYYMGAVFGNRKMYDSAAFYFSKAIELKPNDTTAYFNRAQSYIALDDYRQALEDFSSAIKLNPDYARAYQARAELYELTGDTGSAIADYEVFAGSSYAMPFEKEITQLIIESLKNPRPITDSKAAELTGAVYQAFEEQDWKTVAEYITESDLEKFKETFVQVVQKLSNPDRPYFILWGSVYNAENVHRIPARELFVNIVGGMAAGGEEFKNGLTVDYKDILKTEVINDTCVVVSSRLKTGFPDPSNTIILMDTVRVISGEYKSDLPMMIEAVRQIYESQLNR